MRLKNCFKKLFYSLSWCQTSSRVSEDLGKVFWCLALPVLVRLCSLKLSQHKVKPPFSMFLPQLWPPNGRVSRKSWFVSYSKWLVSMALRQYSLMKSMLLLEQEAVGNMSQVVKCSLNYWFKWMVWALAAAHQLMRPKTILNLRKTLWYLLPLTDHGILMKLLEEDLKREFVRFVLIIILDYRYSLTYRERSPWSFPD